MDSSCHREEERQCLLRRSLDSSRHDEESHQNQTVVIPEQQGEDHCKTENISFLFTTNNNKVNFRRLLLICITATMCYIAIALIGASMKKNRDLKQSSFQALDLHNVPADYVTVVSENMQIVFLNGKTFYCQDDHVTKGCEVLDHIRPQLNITVSSKETVYDYEEVKHQFVQYEGMTYRCPEAHVDNIACSTTPFAQSQPKQCTKGQYNMVLPPAGTDTKPYYFCKSCPAGTYQPVSDSTTLACTPCPQGTWVWFTGAIDKARCTVAAYEAINNNAANLQQQ
jgi:hypothetical protein